MKTTTACLVLLLACLVAAPLSAQLTLEIDTTNKNLYLTGSDIGTSELVSGSQSVSWHFLPPGVSPGAIDITSAISSPIGLDVATVTVGTDGYIAIELSDSSNFNMITGSNTAVSYASLSSAQQFPLSHLIGSTMSLETGSSFSAINIVAYNAVPEPATAAALLGLGALGATTLGRRRRRAA